MSDTINNFRKIYKKDLEFINNQKLRISKREKQIQYLESLFKPSPSIYDDKAKTSVHFNLTPINKKEISSNTNTNFNLPKIKMTPNKTINSYERMRNYKVTFTQRKNNTSNKLKKIFTKSGLSYIPIKKRDLVVKKQLKIEDKKEGNTGENINNNTEEKKNKEDNDIEKNIKTLSQKTNKNEPLKNDIKKNSKNEKLNSKVAKEESEENINQKKKRFKRIKFDYYLKMQTKAESILKPKLGDDSNDLINYIHGIKEIREHLIDNFVSQINNAENRFNSERPEVDSEFLGRDTSLYGHKWKNLFFLKDYQRFFSKGLKGKISNSNYYLMQKKFMEIYNICFGEGRGIAIKPIDWNREEFY